MEKGIEEVTELSVSKDFDKDSLNSSKAPKQIMRII